jgi:Laminin G domain
MQEVIGDREDLNRAARAVRLRGMRLQQALVVGLAAWFAAEGAERKFDFGETPTGGTPPGFHAFVAGAGRPGVWKIAEDDLPNAIKSVTGESPSSQRLHVLEQSGVDVADEHFPVILWEAERYGDMTFSARIKIVSGAIEQIAGLVFHAQDEKNFYVARLNTLQGNVRFYKFVDGQRSEPIGNNLALARGEWHRLSVTCTGNRIQIRVDGTEAMPELTDNTFGAGKIGFITKSDTIAHFIDAEVAYRPLETLATILVRDVVEKQPRLFGVRIYGKTTALPALHVLASREKGEEGLKGTELEDKVFASNQLYFGTTGPTNVVTAPLHDRNGEPVGVIKFFLRRFAGQTEANCIARVLPTIQSVEKRVGSARDLVEE